MRFPNRDRLARAVSGASQMGCLGGAMRVCGTANDLSDPWGSCLKKSHDLDTRKVQGHGEGEAMRTRQDEEEEAVGFRACEASRGPENA